ncbi:MULTISPECIES: hypothetical protein [Virgibacillus]|uniref:hypothetical protein n=1 Tax=Virgibacillus TaxID=84406 RepID=UPI000955881D|nr:MULTISPECIES: hypothetical protein [Virgibacillus]MBS7426762.1 hypothetical protein [Virgibacillus sp. 19R1-5]MBU8566089.1 hypothetical protein [Virgibacillus pantothenticus]MBU8600615.1 hypothetical protein [Virgibacillus pantothenticus]MBU8634409.1 hypothetical protein [Virgibacillus pantothenticus]MBU8642754.1 hypothetical protein [Virgibacillus pantothenticus]
MIKRYNTNYIIILFANGIEKDMNHLRCMLEKGIIGWKFPLTSNDLPPWSPAVKKQAVA